MRPLLLAVLGLLAAAASPARGQDAALDPTYGNVRLRAGFMPDPHTLPLTAGGSVRVAVGRCRYGFVAAAPDVDFHYAGNGRNALYLYARSGSDTTLLVNLPSGAWACNDDGLGGRDPLLVIRQAPSGLYNLWVGTYSTSTAPATLYISEVDPR
jgi:hypothetical protein